MAWISILLGLLPSFAWLFFFMQEDPESDSRVLIVTTFFVGIAFALFALLAQIVFNNYFKSVGIGQMSVTALICFALIEEVCKFWAAYVSTHKNPAFNLPTEAMIYVLVAALGFATIENLAAVGGHAGEAPLLSAVFQTISLRFAGATILHALTSGIVGYHWAMSILSPKRKMLILVSGIVIATAVHTAFNYLILIYGSGGGQEKFIYPIILIIVVGFFVLNDFDRLNSDKVNIEG